MPAGNEKNKDSVKECASTCNYMSLMSVYQQKTMEKPSKLSKLQ